MQTIVLMLLQCAVAAAAWGDVRIAQRSDVGRYQSWRAHAAAALAQRDDADSLAAAAALQFAGRAGGGEALDWAARAAARKPDDPAIGWLRLELCAATVGCNIRDPATTLRWIDPDNGAAWLPSLNMAVRDRDPVEIERVLSEMAATKQFDVYLNRLVTLLYDVLRREHDALPERYIGSDVARLSEALSVVGVETVPSFGALQGACHDVAAGERHDDCLRLAKTLQRGDAILTQMAGFNLERRLLPADGRDAHMNAERRRAVAWRRAAANRFEATALPWVKNSRARSMVSLMRATRREEDVCIAILRSHTIPLDPPEERR